MRTIELLLIGLALTPAYTLAAQVEATFLGPGARVRLWAPAHRLERHRGVVVRVDRDTLVVAHDTLAIRQGRGYRDTVLTILPLTDVERLEVLTGRRSNVAGGIKWGTIIGAGAGLVAGIGVAASCDPQTFMAMCSGGGEDILIGIVGGAFWGLVIGAVVGLFDTVEDWQQVWLAPAVPPVAVGLPAPGLPREQRVGFGLRLRL